MILNLKAPAQALKRKIVPRFNVVASSYFVHVPKAAGSSVVMYILKNGLPFKIHGHGLRSSRYKYAYELIDDRVRDDSFCFVRNPWDRLVSAYHYLENGGNCREDANDFKRLILKYGGFRGFVKFGLGNGNDNIRDELISQIHLKPQLEWLVSEGSDELCVENILRFETLEYDFEIFLKSRGFEFKGLPHVNSSRRKKSDYRSYYDSEMVDIVSEVYREDIERFGYAFE